MNPELQQLIEKNKPDLSKIAGGVELPCTFELLHSHKPSIIEIMEGVTLIKNAINFMDCNRLVSFFEENGNYAPVTIQGLQEFTDNNIGSNRITGFSPTLANDIWYYIKDLIDKIKECNMYSSTDCWQQLNSHFTTWEAAGVSPMLRFMKYQKNGQHYPHYDAGYLYPDSKYRTLKSFVLYLTTNQSGATRFVSDKQSHLPVFERNHNDWDRTPEADEIRATILPVKGDMLLFDHRICHDVEPFIDETGDRIIIRGDIIYKGV